jgi:phenylpropionate dioxygenase-like ring-hydroxylating dioxygenase large terminal subunit
MHGGGPHPADEAAPAPAQHAARRHEIEKLRLDIASIERQTPAENLAQAPRRRGPPPDDPVRVGRWGHESVAALAQSLQQGQSRAIFLGQLGLR